MIEIKNKSECSGCHACYSKCPKNCIEMKRDSEGFCYPEVDKSQCINCGLCIKVCSILNKEHNKVLTKPVAYAAYNKNKEIRLESSSGGLFTLISEEVLNNDGVVFGACFDKDFNVIHDYVETKEKLGKFRGSKYVQSKIGESYSKAKEFLDSGKQVLFTGTPCQMGGLYSYLGKEYSNLITQDIICHGVPSQRVWQKYIEFREKESDSKVQKIAFRQKNEGWKLYSVSFLFKNDTEYRKTQNEDLMMRAFLTDSCLRPSCHSCSFKNINRQADITLADFWGIQNVMPEMDDDKGTSLIILNSDKGKEIFKNLEEKIIFKETDFNEAIKYNSAMIKSAKPNKNREKFFQNLDKMSFEKLVKKYCEPSILKKLMMFPYRVLRKIKNILVEILKK